MTKDEAIKSISYLESEYNRQYNSAQQAQIIEVLMQYSGKVAGRAIDALFDLYTSLPRPSDFKNKVREYGAKEFEQGVDKEKRDIAMGSDKAFSGDTNGVKCFTAIAAMFSDPERRFTRAQILDAYRKAAQHTGSNEWNLAGARMQAHYEQNGMALDQPPTGNIVI